MKSQSQLRNSRRHPALLPRVQEVLCSGNGSLIPSDAQPFSHNSSPDTGHRPNQSLAKHNRKTMQLTENKRPQLKSIASFCRDSRRYVTLFQTSRNRHRFPQLTAHQSLITPHESRGSQRPTHGIMLLSYALRASLTDGRSCAAGHRQPARHETGFGLLSSNLAALLSRH